MEKPQVNKKDDLNKALAGIKAELTAVKKDGLNPHFRSQFATLNAHLKAVEPLLEKWGCTLTQPIGYDGRTGVNVQITKITHVKSGESVESSLVLGEQKDMQKLGSAITYARRYTLGSLLAMQAEDDDGNAAVGKVGTKSKGGSVVAKGDF